MAATQVLAASNLIETGIGAVIAGVGIPTAISLAMLGYLKAPELWRAGDRPRGYFYGAVGGLGLVAALAIFAIGMAIVIDGPHT